MIDMQKFNVYGFLSFGTFKNNKRDAFYLYDLASGEKMQLCSTEKSEKWEPFFRFYFNPEAITRGNQILEDAPVSKNTIIVIDEIGPRELDKKGWYHGIKKTRNTPGIKIYVVRKSILQQVIDKFSVREPVIIDIQKFSPDQFSEIINGIKV